MRVDDMLKDYKEWGKGDLGAIVRAARFVEDQNQDLHNTLAQVTEENGQLREQVRAARAHLMKGMPASALAALEGQEAQNEQ